MRRYPLPFLSLLLPVLALAPGCGGEPPPVAVVEVGSPEIELPHRRFATLDLAWRMQEPLTDRSGQLYVFVHLLDEPGSVVRTFDYRWTGSWHTGGHVEHQVTVHQSAIGPPLEPGTYALTLGLYDEEGRRWPLITPGELVERREYKIADVRVPVESGGEPMFQFSPDWLDSESGRDRQVLERRWLTGAGHLRATGVEGPGELWLRLLVPTAGDRHELVLAEGAAQQGTVVRTDCGDVEVRLAGTGGHDVVLPITPAADADSCTVEIVPDFYLLELESGARRTVSLDGLGWSPSAG